MSKEYVDGYFVTSQQFLFQVFLLYFCLFKQQCNNWTSKASLVLILLKINLLEFQEKNYFSLPLPKFFYRNHVFMNVCMSTQIWDKNLGIFLFDWKIFYILRQNMWKNQNLQLSLFTLYLFMNWILLLWYLIFEHFPFVILPSWLGL